MAAAGIAGLLRSVATRLRLAHAPPLHHPLAAPGIHPGFSRFPSRRPISSSLPGFNNSKAVQKNKKIVSNQDSAREAIIKMACLMMLASSVYMVGWVIPTMKSVNGKLAAFRAKSKRDQEFIQVVKHEREKMRDSLQEHHQFMTTLIEAMKVATNNSQYQIAWTSGNGKQCGGVADV